MEGIVVVVGHGIRLLRGPVPQFPASHITAGKTTFEAAEVPPPVGGLTNSRDVSGNKVKRPEESLRLDPARILSIKSVAAPWSRVNATDRTSANRRTPHRVLSAPSCRTASRGTLLNKHPLSMPKLRTSPAETGIRTDIAAPARPAVPLRQQPILLSWNISSRPGATNM